MYTLEGDSQNCVQFSSIQDNGSERQLRSKFFVSNMEATRHTRHTWLFQFILIEIK